MYQLGSLTSRNRHLTKLSIIGCEIRVRNKDFFRCGGWKIRLLPLKKINPYGTTKWTLG